MTNNLLTTDFVISQRPAAYSVCAGDGVWEIYSEANGECIGIGLSERSAWADAAENEGFFNDNDN